MTSTVAAIAAAKLRMLGWAAAVILASAGGAAAGPTLVYEPATDRVLHAEEIDRAWFPASLTKMMTAYVVFQAVKAGRIAWDAPVELSAYARSQPATRINLRVGINPTVEQAVHGLILRSANDLAVALAETVAGSESAFVDEMNVTAARLGMSRSQFRNPHGLPHDEQVSTARDMVILARAVLTDFPDRAGVFNAQSVLIHKGMFANQNDLLVTLPGADGMKTGFTCGAGYNVVASATRHGRKLIAVVLGEPNRNDRSRHAAALLEAGFAEIEKAAKPADPVKLAAMTLNVDAAAEARDASRWLRMRKCTRPDPVAKGAAPALAIATPATGEPRLALPEIPRAAPKAAIATTAPAASPTPAARAKPAAKAAARPAAKTPGTE